jgi:hypothetical protein
MDGSNFIATGASSVIAINFALRPLVAYSRKYQRSADYTYTKKDYFIIRDRNLQSGHCMGLTPPKQAMDGEFRASYLFVKAKYKINTYPTLKQSFPRNINLRQPQSKQFSPRLSKYRGFTAFFIPVCGN